MQPPPLIFLTRRTRQLAYFFGSALLFLLLTFSHLVQAAPTTPYTAAEVATHNTQTSCWSIIDNNVYDLTNWIPQHPGGRSVIISLCGINGSTSFHGQHGNASLPNSTLASYQIGVLSTGGADTTLPSTPAGLTASPLSSNQVNLSWSASTDNVGVTGYRLESCTGASCTTYAQIAAPAGTTYSNTGLAAATTYRYRVRATDAAGNLSAYSTVVNATTPAAPDTTAPTPPSGLTVTAQSSTQLNLSWTASTDAVGVTAYQIESCAGAACTTYAQIASQAGTTYSNTGLTAGTTYRYRVRATDAAGNLSSYSAVTNGTTQAAADTTPPAISAVSVTAITSSGATIQWTTNEVADSQVEYGLTASYGSQTPLNASLVTAHSIALSGLTANSLYNYRVKSQDAAANAATSGNFTFTTSAVATTTPPDTTNPSQPGGLTATPVSTAQVNLAWNASTDNVGVVNYRVYQCTGAACTNYTQVATVTSPAYAATTLAAGTTYRFRVRAYDAAGNASNYSTTVNAMTPAAPDTTAPTTPGTPTATPVSASQITISWAASTDAVGVTAYQIESCAGAACTTYAQIASQAGTTYSNTGLTAGTTYRYRVRATDAAGNLSSYSAVTNGTTQAAAPPPDTTAPTVSLTAPSSGSSVSGSVTVSAAASDNVGVVGVQFLLDGSNVGSEYTSAPYSMSWNTLTVGNGTHILSARARDAAGNQTTSGTVSVTVSNVSQQMGTYTAADVAFHGTASSCWSIIDGNVYNLTAWIPQHPGGTSVIIALCGRDGSASFHAQHGTATLPNSTLAGFKIGTFSSAGTPPATDTSPPSVSLTAPQSGTTISNTITISANASDDTGVVGVQFFVDNVNIGDDTSSPYSILWNTTGVSNGSHIINVRARDAAGNYTFSAAATLTVTNVTQPPPQQQQPGTYTAAQVAEHATAQNCWTIIDGNVYNLTAWIPLHPGGSSVIIALCGRDGSSSFRAQHGSASLPNSTLASYKVGTFTTVTQGVNQPPTPAPSGVVVLSRDLSVGSTGADVLTLQLTLRTLGHLQTTEPATNYFGPATQAAVKKFQEVNGIVPADGVFNASTRLLLNTLLAISPQLATTTRQGSVPPAAVPTQTQTGGSASYFTVVLSRGVSHSQVALLQQILVRENVFPEAVISGFFGGLTEAAVKRFQTKYGIITSGTSATTGYGAVGPRTRAKLNQVSYGVTLSAPASATPAVTPKASTIPVQTLTTKLGLARTVYTIGSINVRSAPSTAGPVIKVQPANTMGSTTDGPIIANGYIWWNVKYTNGISGWTAEHLLTTTGSSAPTPVSPTPPASGTPAPTAPKATTPPPPATISPYSAAGVAQHNTEANCWSIVDSSVYNLTAWIPLHPGGKSMIIAICGKDGSVSFHTQHGTNPLPRNLLSGYKLAPLSN